MTFLRAAQDRTSTLMKNHPRWSIAALVAAGVLLVLVILALVGAFSHGKAGEVNPSATGENSFVRQLQLQQDVRATVKNVDASLSSNGSVAKVLQRRDLVVLDPKLYDEPLPKIAVKAAGSGFIVIGSDGTSGYSYTYTSSDKAYVAEQAPQPQPSISTRK